MSEVYKSSRVSWSVPHDVCATTRIKFRRMRSGRVRIFNGNQWETLYLINQELIGLLTWWQGWSRDLSCTATFQGQKVKSQGYKVT